MTVITVNVADTNPRAVQWELPASPDVLRSPIPRGLNIFEGSNAIALLGAGDETSYRLTCTLPTGYAYIPRNYYVTYTSDDLVANFNVIGQGAYGVAGFDRGIEFNMISPGEMILGATLAQFTWLPGRGTQKPIMVGGDTFVVRLADMASGGSTAGDMVYMVEFYVFDVDQIDKWQINTAVPVTNYSSF